MVKIRFHKSNSVCVVTWYIYIATLFKILNNVTVCILLDETKQNPGSKMI